jgi:hypothetical protein
MNKATAKAIKRKEAQSMARNARQLYSELIVAQRQLPWRKRQLLAIRIAYGVPIRVKIKNFASGLGSLLGRLHWGFDV